MSGPEGREQIRYSFAAPLDGRHASQLRVSSLNNRPAASKSTRAKLSDVASREGVHLEITRGVSRVESVTLVVMTPSSDASTLGEVVKAVLREVGFEWYALRAQSPEELFQLSPKAEALHWLPRNRDVTNKVVERLRVPYRNGDRTDDAQSELETIFAPLADIAAVTSHWRDAVINLHYDTRALHVIVGMPGEKDSARKTVTSIIDQFIDYAIVSGWRSSTSLRTLVQPGRSLDRPDYQLQSHRSTFVSQCRFLGGTMSDMAVKGVRGDFASYLNTHTAFRAVRWEIVPAGSLHTESKDADLMIWGNTSSICGLLLEQVMKAAIRRGWTVNWKVPEKGLPRTIHLTRPPRRMSIA